MIKSCFILLIFSSLALTEEHSILFNEANEFYSKKDYQKSAELYEHIL